MKVRRPHRKTRTGCFSCKKRRIKCDEQKPSCLNCLRRGYNCEYLSRPLDSDNQDDAVTHTPSPGNDLPELPMTELRLLHHFTTSTYATMSSRENIKTIWRVTVPQLAFSCDCLMRAILALSALHLSRLEPEERRMQYQKLAVSHYDAALRSSTLTILHLSVENCHALYACSELIFLFNLVHPHLSPNPLLSYTNEVAPWLTLLRGIRTIAYPFVESLKVGVLGPLLAVNEGSAPDKTIIESLDVFDAHIRRSQITNPSTSTYLAAIENLRQWSVDMDGHGFRWAVHVDEDYVSLLRRMEPEALVVFAHFALVVKKWDSNYWLRGWADRLVDAIHGALGDSHRAWIRRILEQFGMAR
ncbi:hypothetical protein BDV25DRAFT_153477 [Aspergillus avenaceus]|uniref:Zn(2)-C6 fungal-type domain-containing protein n=1 Tax=Aspergillus avenaceus TaxID=36643 RepID=A0A5N6TXB7_ASPAV|nr:hypothetical protein BDV25DRAFT_153477 [Aspergillus avenaceus]